MANTARAVSLLGRSSSARLRRPRADLLPSALDPRRKLLLHLVEQYLGLLLHRSEQSVDLFTGRSCAFHIVTERIAVLPYHPGGDCSYEDSSQQVCLLGFAHEPLCGPSHGCLRALRLQLRANLPVWVGSAVHVDIEVPGPISIKLRAR